ALSASGTNSVGGVATNAVRPSLNAPPWIDIVPDSLTGFIDQSVSGAVCTLFMSTAPSVAAQTWVSETGATHEKLSGCVPTQQASSASLSIGAAPLKSMRAMPEVCEMSAAEYEPPQST